jgi:hypothetical protein
MPLEELEKLKALRVKIVKENTELVRLLTVRMAPTATISDLLQKVRILLNRVKIIFEVIFLVRCRHIAFGFQRSLPLVQWLFKLNTTCQPSTCECIKPGHI